MYSSQVSPTNLLNRQIAGSYRRAATSGGGGRSSLNLNSKNPSPLASPSIVAPSGSGNSEQPNNNESQPSTSAVTLDSTTQADGNNGVVAETGTADISTLSVTEGSKPRSIGSKRPLPNGDSNPDGGPTSSKPPTSKRSKSSRHTRDRDRDRSPDASPSSSSLPTSLPALRSKHPSPPHRFSHLGGLDSVIERLLELVALPVLHPEIYHYTGVKPTRGVLLWGPSGTGKTALAGAVAGELGLPFVSISAPSLISGMSGESEKAIRETFEEATKLAPSILFIDEIDAITGKRENAQREMERRIVAQLLTCFDELSAPATSTSTSTSPFQPPPTVIVLGATNRPDSLDPALRRAGRFDHEIGLGVPDEKGREAILRTLLSPLRLSGEFDISFLARSTPGYVGADLTALTSAAGVVAVKRIFERLGKHPVGGRGVGETTEGEVENEIVKNIDGEEDRMMLDNEEGQQGLGEERVVENVKPTTPIAVNPTNPQAVPGTTLDANDMVEDSTDDAVLSKKGVPPLFQPSLSPTLSALPISTFLLSHPSPLPTSLLSSLSLTPSDFLQALTHLTPSSLREGFTTVPSVTWSSIGGLTQIRDELRMGIVKPIKRREVFEWMGIDRASGMLLWGPPGCGKTLVAKAVANESGANFISVKGPELLNKYVGESERSVRQVFARARASSPCIIFFDELDALVPRRDDNLSESSSRVVNTLLTELDGLSSRGSVYVVGATNRPDMIDPAMVRPGRLDKMLYIDLPTPLEREEILKAQTRLGSDASEETSSRTPLGVDVDLKKIAFDERCDAFTGADLSALVREAAMMSLREILDRDSQDDSSLSLIRKEDVRVMARHFDIALSRVTPSVSVKQRRRYELLRSRMSGQPVGRHELDGEAKDQRAGGVEG